MLACRVRIADHYESPLALPHALAPWFTGGGSIPFIEELIDPFTHLPEAVTRLILRDDRSGRRDVIVAGPHTRAMYNVAEAPASCLRLHLAPGAVRPLLGVAAAELADRFVPLHELPGPLAKFTDQLQHSSPDEALALLEHALPQRISDDPDDRSRRALLHAATATLSTAPTRVPEVAAGLAVSERQLRNLFTTGIGVSPKHFARIGRVRRLLAEAAHAPLADVAVETGFYDQSHMTADFRTLMGVAPTAFLRGQLPAATPCGTYLPNRRPTDTSPPGNPPTYARN